MTTTFRSLEALLNQLGDRDIHRLLVEGGPTTVHAFLDAGLVDEFYLVKSTATHAHPVPSNLDSSTLEKAGLSHASDEQWGDETVEYWTR